jgi:eukaryotic-like serine/threonine-protein kinase
VWRAIDENAGRDVAVKTLRARSAGSDRPGFGLVYASVAALSNPGIAQVHHYAEEPATDGRPAIAYLVRDLVPGPTLEERLAGGSLPAAEALRYVASVADALAAAHGEGVVHGNLVPSNVINGPAGVQVTDFGLAALRERPPDERFQSVLSYAAPERLGGEPATTASDMYSLGVLFVACLSGIAAAGTSGSPPVTDPADDPVTPGLAALWAACLGANPRERPSAAHVAFMSRQAVGAQPAAATQPAGTARAGEEPGQRAQPGQRAGEEPGQRAEPGLRAGAEPGQSAEPGRRAASGRDAPGQRGAAVPAGRQPADGAPDGAAHPVTARPGTGRTGAGRAGTGRTRTGRAGAGRGERAGHGAGPGRRRRVSRTGSGPAAGTPAGTGPGSRRALRDRRIGVAPLGRGGLLAICAAAAGVAVAAVVLTQFLTSPAAQTTGAPATPSVQVTATHPAETPRPTADPLPSAEATSSVLASATPPPLQVLGQIQATIRRGVASGQIRQDVGVDLTNLLQPVQEDLVAGNTAGVAQLVGGLKAKLTTRLGEGAITPAAGRQLNGEFSTLLQSVSRAG